MDSEDDKGRVIKPGLKLHEVLDMTLAQVAALLTSGPSTMRMSPAEARAMSEEIKLANAEAMERLLDL